MGGGCQSSCKRFTCFESRLGWKGRLEPGALWNVNGDISLVLIATVTFETLNKRLLDGLGWAGGITSQGLFRLIVDCGDPYSWCFFSPMVISADGSLSGRGSSALLPKMFIRMWVPYCRQCCSLSWVFLDVEVHEVVVLCSLVVCLVAMTRLRLAS